MLSAILLQLCGFAALAAAMPRHARHIVERLPLRYEERAASSLGWLLLAVSLALSIADQGAAYGLLTWLGTAPFTAGAVLLLLTYRAPWLIGIGGAALVVAVIGAVF